MERFRSNVDLARRVYDLIHDYLTGEDEPAASLLAELIRADAALVPSSALSSGSVGPYHGAAGMLEFWRAVKDKWSSFELHPDEFVDVPPDTVVVMCRVVATGPRGQDYAVKVGHLLRFEDGQVAAATSFQSPALALEHAGVTGAELASRDGSEKG